MLNDRTPAVGDTVAGANGYLCTIRYVVDTEVLVSALGVSIRGNDGVPGATGATGRSIMAVERTSGTGAAGTTDTYTITYSDNTKSIFRVYNGKDGQDGQPGEKGETGAAGKDGANGKDGVSPTISVTAITGGHRVSITDANGTKTFDVMDGEDGEDGADGNAANIVIDGEFSNTSENPVQNKVITAAMAQAAQTLGELASGLEQGEQAIQFLATKMLPDVTDTDNGKLLQVVDGAWAAVAIAAAETESF